MSDVLPKLNLDPAHLAKLFAVDFKRRILRYADGIDGAEELNLQLLYNWAKRRWHDSEAMPFDYPFRGRGFLGQQPVIEFINDYRFQVPDVPTFLVRGTFVTGSAGAPPPFIIGEDTKVTYTPLCRPQLYLFLSHASPDKPIVREFSQRLDVTHRTFLDEVDTRVGESIPVRVSKALKDCHAAILFLSESALDRPWVDREWGAMLMQEKSVLPVLLGIDPSDMPAALQATKAAIHQGSVADTICQLEGGLERLLEAKAATGGSGA